ncbi:MAG: 4Fe-4S binding protein, partial [Muribaculaceae bacterium]|nr:4Fe-4S binding protein [Muribaculaceae bacterium]
YYYDLGSCTFCMLCVTTCPQDALEFTNDFEQAVFTRDKLVKVLNAHSELTDAQVIAEASKPKPKPAMDPEQLAKIKAEALAKAAAKKAAQQAAQKPDTQTT